MKYSEKIKYAEIVADKLHNEESIEQVKQYLKGKGLFEYDINNIIASGRNIISEKYKPLIRAKLLEGVSLKNVKELEKLGDNTLNKLIKQEVESISAEERKKVKELIKRGTSTEKILDEIKLDFYSKENINRQISTYRKIDEQNKLRLSKKLRKLYYEIDYDEGLTLTSIEKIRNSIWYFIVFGIGVIRLLQQDYIFSIIPLLGGIYFIIEKRVLENRFKVLNRDHKKISITNEGIIIYNPNENKKIELNKEKLSDLEIDIYKENDYEFMILKTHYNKEQEIQILKVFNTSSKIEAIVYEVANMILELWE